MEDNPPHLPEREVSVGKEVSHLTIGVIDVVKQVPLDRVVLVISVAVEGGAEVLRHVPQLVGLVPENQYFKLTRITFLRNLPFRAHPEHISLVTVKMK